MADSTSNNLLTHYIPIGSMMVILGAVFWLGQKIEQLDALNTTITAYMETYNAERFVTLEQKMVAMDASFDARVIAIVRDTFFEN